MQHLNIPLSRNNQTTRRTRWVVWLLASASLFVILASFWISTLWFTRDTIYKAAPEHTIMATRFFISGKKGAHVESIFKQLPLISNRSLTFSDLAPYISGEFVVFLSEDNSRSVALRLGNKALPQALLDAHSIVEQSIGHNIVLLSEKHQLIKSLITKPKVFPGISYPGHIWIGEVIEQSENKRSFISVANDHIEISMNEKMANARPFKHFPNDTIAYLSTPVWTKAAEDFSKSILPTMQFISDPKIVSSFEEMTSAQGQIVLTQDKDGVGFFLTTHTRDAKNLPNLEQILRTIAALVTPKIQETLLDDGTTIKEIVSNPDAISIEQITVLGTLVNRVRTNTGDIMTGLIENNGFFLTNRETLFRSYKGQNISEKKICSGNLAGISLHSFGDNMIQHANFPNNNAILFLSQNFSRVGIESGLFSTKINFCP